MFWLWLRGFKTREEVIVRRNKYRVVLPAVGEIEVSLEVNCLGASCPRPQILVMKAFKRLGPGEVLELISDNASSVESVEAVALVLNAQHVATVRDDRAWRVYLGRESATMQSREVG